jgi:hypothetical protein
LCISGLSGKEAEIDAANTMTVETAIAKAMTPRDKERNQHGKRYSLAQLSGPYTHARTHTHTHTHRSRSCQVHIYIYIYIYI